MQVGGRELFRFHVALWLGLAALLPVSVAFAAGDGVEPQDYPNFDPLIEVEWCGERRAVFEDGDQCWIVYEAISLKGVLPSKENCDKAVQDPAKPYVGLFAVHFKSNGRPGSFVKPYWNPPNHEFLYGQVYEFVSYAGSTIPVMTNKLGGWKWNAFCVPFNAGEHRDSDKSSTSHGKR